MSEDSRYSFAFMTRVKRVFHHKPIVRGIRAKEQGGDPVLEYGDNGWFVHLSGSYEAIHVGDTEPRLKVGDMVKVTIERVAQ